MKFEETLGQMFIGSLTITTIISILGICFLYYWIWSIRDMIRNDFKKDSNKIVWCILLIGMPPIGTALYLTMSEDQKEINDPYSEMITKIFNKETSEPKPY